MLYVFLGIALFIVFILLLKINIVIDYKENLTLYLRILFFKIKLFPRDKKKESKKKKSSTTSKSSQGKADGATAYSEKKEKGIPSKLFEIRDILLKICAKIPDKLHFKHIYLNIKIGSDNACTTALLHSAVSQGIAYIIEILRNISNIEVSKKSSITVESNFLSEECHFEGKVVLFVRVGSIIALALGIIKDIIIRKYKTEENEYGSN